MKNDGPGQDDLTRLITGCGFAVAHGLGAEFLDKAAEQSPAVQAPSRRLIVEQQRATDVRPEGRFRGATSADLIVRDAVMPGLKAASAPGPASIAQAARGDTPRIIPSIPFIPDSFLPGRSGHAALPSLAGAASAEANT